jgi:hypothetical protein
MTKELDPRYNYTRHIDDYMDPKVARLYKELVAQVVGARKVRNLSVKGLNRMSGVGESTIGRLEKFQANVNVSTLIQLLDSMDLKLAILPRNVDMETIRQANIMLQAYMIHGKGHFPE